MSKSLTESFDFKPKYTDDSTLNDYDVFKDKKLLDNLRKKIIEDLVDKEIPTNMSMTDFVNEEIDRCLVGYDLTNLERNHIFDLIESEINGYGPITELLNDDNVTQTPDINELLSNAGETMGREVEVVKVVG